MPLAPARMEDCIPLRIARRKVTRAASCSAMPWATSWASISGFFTSRMLSWTCLPVSFSSAPRRRSASAPRRPMTSPDGRCGCRPARGHGCARSRPWRCRPVHALGEQGADGDVFLHVVAVALTLLGGVGEPAAAVVGGDAQAVAVRVDLLPHQRAPPLVVRGPTSTVMWLVRLLMRLARPWARGRTASWSGLVDEGGRHDEGTLVERRAVSGRRRTGRWRPRCRGPSARLAGGLRGEPHERLSLRDGLAPDGSTTRRAFMGRHADVPRHGLGFHGVSFGLGGHQRRRPFLSPSRDP